MRYTPFTLHQHVVARRWRTHGLRRFTHPSNNQSSSESSKYEAKDESTKSLIIRMLDKSPPQEGAISGNNLETDYSLGTPGLLKRLVIGIRSENGPLMIVDNHSRSLENLAVILSSLIQIGGDSVPVVWDRRIDGLEYSPLVRV